MKIDRLRVGEIDTICYLITSDKKNTIIIDPGGDPEKILDYITKVEFSPQIILLTHGHYDHIEAIPDIRRQYNVPVYVAREDAEMLTTPMWSRYLNRPFPVIKPDFMVEDNQELKVDELLIKVITTPGHSPGSVSYIIGSSVFTGDTLFAQGGVGRTDLYKSSQSQIVHSIRSKLFLLPDDTAVYPGHGNSSTIGKEKHIHGISKKN